MAEFGDVMRQLRRRCNAFHSECKVCGMGDFCPNEVCVDMLTDSDIDRLEKSVMEWAKEFPEPVYPTWLEWLQEMGVMTDIHDRLNNYKQVMEVCGKPLYSIPTTKVFCHIPADIAEKLGIEPKEG